MARWTAKGLWQALPRATRLSAARALWDDEHLDRAERLRVLMPWLQARGMRYPFLEKLPRARRAELMAAGGLPEETAAQVLRSYHLVHEREMLARFLDRLGLPHEGGLISSDAEIEPPGDEDLAQAATGLREEFPRERVDLYLRSLVATDPETWAAIEPLL